MKQKNYMDLSQYEWSQKYKTDADAFLLDVRTVEEFDERRLPNAQNIDIYLGQDFIKQIELLDKSKNYYVYCKAGGRSAQACAIMNDMGFKNAYNLVGGIINWKGETV